VCVHWTSYVECSRGFFRVVQLIIFIILHQIGSVLFSLKQVECLVYVTDT
jgi:hypothetical protein